MLLTVLVSVSDIMNNAKEGKKRSMAKSMGLNISWFALLSHAEQDKPFLLTCRGKQLFKTCRTHA